MNINKKTRTELKNYFKKNAIPTEGNFADFIDAGVNQKDDGLYKPAGQPLSLEAAMDGAKPAIQFYETFAGNASWMVSLAIPGSPPNSSTPAFAVSDGIGTPRLWIDPTGAVTAPGAVTVGSLTTTGAITAASITTTGGASTGALTVTSLLSSGPIVVGGLISANAGANVTGAPLNVGTSAGNAQPLNVWGTLTANSTATVTGLLTATGGLTTPGAINTGTLTASGSITASGGLQVPAGKTLLVNGTLTAGTTNTGNTTTGGLTATGALNANGGITIPAGFGLSVGGSITAGGFFAAGGLMSANGGLMVPLGQSLTVNGALTANSSTTTAALTANGLITANFGITAPVGQTVTINGNLQANGTASIGLLTVSGVLNANGGISIPAGFSMTTASPIFANGGLTVPAGKTLSAAGSLFATGGFMALGGDISLAPITRSGMRLDKNASQHLLVPTIPATVAFDTGVTIQAWIYLYSFDDFARIVDFGNGMASDNILFYIHADGSLGTQMYRGTTPGAVLKSTVGILSLFTWTHVAVTVDNTGVMKLYKDGVLVGTSTASGGNIPLAIQRTVNYLGRSQWPGNPYFNGILTEISMWTGARAVISTHLVGNETGLIAYWANGANDFCTNPGHIGTVSTFNFPRFVSAFDRGNQVTILQEDWASPTLNPLFPTPNPAWAEFNVNNNPPGYFKDSFNVVHLRGLLAPGPSGSVIFILPTGYHPPFNERFVTSTSASTCGYVEVATTGNVTAVFSSASWVSLDGITFRAI